jgi:hypothetical protein
MGFINNFVNLGNIKEQTTNNLMFKWYGEVPEDLNIIKITASCGCTTPVWNAELGTLNVVYKAGKIPKHLKSVGKVHSVKRVKMETNLGTFELSFEGWVYNEWNYNKI